MFMDIVWHEEGMEKAISRNTVSIIIDVLRGSTTLIALTTMKSSKILSFVSRSEMLKAYNFLKGKNKNNIFLVGESKGYKESDFHFGNSPSQIINNANAIKSSIILFKSTNISKIINRYQNGLTIFIGSTVNCSAVAKRAYRVAERKGQDILLIPVGRCSRFLKRKDVEDEMGAILIMRELLKLDELTLSDRANKEYRKTKHLSDKSLTKRILNTQSAQYLKSIGYEKDVILASKINYFQNIVPILDVDIINSETMHI